MSLRFCRLFLIAILALPGLANSADVLVGQVKDGIGPATTQFVDSILAQALEDQSQLVLLEMDTPGGLDAATRDIVQSILASPVPVAVYVTPDGARAASAGTYILYSAHIAAMAPATNLGAATPVSIGGGGSLPQSPGDQSGEDDARASDNTETTSEKNPESETQQDAGRENPGGSKAQDGAMRAKVVNDAAAYIRSLAERRGRNAQWAERAVREGATLTASEAAAQNVIDLVAENRQQLLEALDGRTVDTVEGEVTLSINPDSVEMVLPDWRTELLGIITNPNIAYILLIIGFYGLMFEGYNPGAILPGVVGAICLLVALFALQMLPISYAGLGLIILGLLLVTAEAFVPSFGALGLGGLVALILGTIMLMDTDIPGFEISTGVLVAVAVVSAVLFLLALLALAKARKRPQVSGAEELAGAVGEAETTFAETGWIHVHGERWRAQTNAPVTAGQSVRVKLVDGLTLHIEPLAS